MGMSYLSEISWTDREFSWVATRIRSAYSSVRRREISFSRIVVARFFGYIKCLATRLSGLRLNLHDGSEHRFRHPLRVREREIVQLRVRFLTVQHNRPVEILHSHVLRGHARELLARCIERGRQPDEEVPLPAHSGDVARELLEDAVSVHGLQGVEREQGEKRMLGL